MNRRRDAFTTVEILVAIVLFTAAMSGMLYVGNGMRAHQTATVASSQRNAYATFQSEVALQGINPALVGNPLSGAINQRATAGTTVSLGNNTSLSIQRGTQAGFEPNAISAPTAAQRDLGGSARVDALQYAVAGGGLASGGNGGGRGLGRGTGFGFSVEIAGPAAPSAAIPLAPPIFNAYFNQSGGNDLTNAPFPLNNIATLPTSNPPGTTYHFTTDGSLPTINSPLWDNNPGWTPATFPAQVKLAAFNSDPQYATSAAVTTSLYMSIVLTYSRADGRAPGLQFGFALSDRTRYASATGIVLTTNVDGYGLPLSVRYSLDGSDPTLSGTAYAGPFVPAQAQFNPTVPLAVTASSTDPRIHSASPLADTLGTDPAPLGPPTFITSNAAPLTPGTAVQLSVGSSGAPGRK